MSALAENLLGAVLKYGYPALSQINPPLQAEEFPRNDHRVLFQVIASLAQQGKPCDASAVMARLNGSLPDGISLSRLVNETLLEERSVAAYAREFREAGRKAAYDSPPNDGVPPLWEKITKGAPARKALAFIDFTGMTAHLTDGYTIKGVLGRNTLIAIIGPSGSGKTFIATDMAGHIAASKPWQGCRVKGGPVVYAALEGPASAENRFVAMRAALQLSADVPLRLTPGPINLRDKADVQLLITLIREAEAHYSSKVVAVFIDTLSRAMAGGNENAPEDMGALIAGADAVRIETGATVILVHHMGKDEDRGARGHSSLKGAVDTEIEVIEKGGLHVATVTKQRDMVKGTQFAFELHSAVLGQDEDGDAVTTCVVHPVAPPPPQKPVATGENQRKLLAALQEWNRQHPEKEGLLSHEDIVAISKAQQISSKRRPEVVRALVELNYLAECLGGHRFTP